VWAGITKTLKKYKKMNNKPKKQQQQSQTSPKGGTRACLCKDGKKYSIKCCDGSLQAQGIGQI
jgi:hypothetical protein